MERYAIGIDVHKKFDNAHMVYAEYKESNKRIDGFIESFNKEFRKFSSSATELLRMARYLGNRDCHVLIENSTNSHDVYHVLKNAGVKVTVAHATDLRQITKSVKKNDKMDARKLAHYMRRRLNGEMEFAESFIPSKEWMERKEICRYIAEDRLMIGNTKKQIRAHLAIVGNKDFDGYENVLSVKSRQSLKELNDICINNLVEKAETTMRREKRYTDLIEKEMRSESMYKIIYSVPGAGVLTAAYLSTIIVDIDRFSNSNQFSAFFGLVPKMYDSGDTSPNCGITRRGDPVARRLIYQMTFVHMRFEDEGHIAEKYKRLKKAGKSRNVSMVACCNSMLRMLYVMLTEGKEYIYRTEALEESRAMADSISESEGGMQEIQ